MIERETRYYLNHTGTDLEEYMSNIEREREIIDYTEEYLREGGRFANRRWTRYEGNNNYELLVPDGYTSPDEGVGATLEDLLGKKEAEKIRNGSI